jgi:hypothetical protein
MADTIYRYENGQKVVDTTTKDIFDPKNSADKDNQLQITDEDDGLEVGENLNEVYKPDQDNKLAVDKEELAETAEAEDEVDRVAQQLAGVKEGGDIKLAPEVSTGSLLPMKYWDDDIKYTFMQLNDKQKKAWKRSLGITEKWFQKKVEETQQEMKDYEDVAKVGAFSVQLADKYKNVLASKAGSQGKLFEHLQGYLNVLQANQPFLDANLTIPIDQYLNNLVHMDQNLAQGSRENILDFACELLSMHNLSAEDLADNIDSYNDKVKNGTLHAPKVDPQVNSEIMRLQAEIDAMKKEKEQTAQVSAEEQQKQAIEEAQKAITKFYSESVDSNGASLYPKWEILYDKIVKVIDDMITKDIKSDNPLDTAYKIVYKEVYGADKTVAPKKTVGKKTRTKKAKSEDDAIYSPGDMDELYEPDEDEEPEEVEDKPKRKKHKLDVDDDDFWTLSPEAKNRLERMAQK